MLSALNSARARKEQGKMQEQEKKEHGNRRCRCEQCGRTISDEEYTAHGCVCFDCWIENETGFKD
jgi:hypothetical protein